MKCSFIFFCFVTGWSNKWTVLLFFLLFYRAESIYGMFFFILFALLQCGAIHGVLFYRFCFFTRWSITWTILLFFFALLQGGVIHRVVFYSFCLATGWSNSWTVIIFVLLCCSVEQYMDYSFILFALPQGGVIHGVFLYILLALP